jgi:hypothetical protein
MLRTHKFGIEIPKSAGEALDIDKRTNTTFWKDAGILNQKQGMLKEGIQRMHQLQ